MNTQLRILKQSNSLNTVYYLWIAGLIFNSLSYIYIWFEIPAVITGLILISLSIYYVTSLSKPKSPRQHPQKYLNNLLKNIPKKLEKMLIISFFYMFINFGYFIITVEGNPHYNSETQQYELLDRGRFIKQLTRIEYYRHKLIMFRGMYGHFLFFYLIFYTMIYKEKEKEKLSNKSFNKKIRQENSPD